MLSERQFRGIIDLLASLIDLDDPPGFAAYVLPRLATVVPGDLLTYNEADPRTGAAIWVAQPPEAVPDGFADVFARHLHEHPLLRHYLTTHDDRPVMLSDLLSRRELHGLEIYRQFLRPLGIEYQIGIRLPWQADLTVGLTVGRSRSDFTEDEREMLALLQQPLLRAAVRLRRTVAARLLVSPPDAVSDLLSSREEQVLRAVAQGHTNGAIARLLGVSPRTVDKHLEHIYRKLRAGGRMEAVRKWLGDPSVPAPRQPDDLTLPAP